MMYTPSDEIDLKTRSSGGQCDVPCPPSGESSGHFCH